MGLEKDNEELSSQQVPIANGDEATEERKPLSRKLKLLTASAIFFGNITFGCAFNTYGPALTSLQHKYETDDSTISRVFSILTGCYMIGGLTGGFIFNYVNRQFAVIVLLGTIASMMILTPLCPTMTLFFITAAVMGLCSGAYDTAQFVWMMEMMQKDCPPYVQGQHFFYALGTNLASLIVAPFLDEEESDDDGNSSSTTAKPETDSSKLFIPYLIVGGLMIVAVIYHILLFLFMRYSEPPTEKSEDDNEPSQNSITDGQSTVAVVPDSDRPGWMWPLPKLGLVLLCCCFYGAYQGMEMCTFQFFPKFGQNSDLHLSESDSAYVLTGMTAAFAVGRGIAIVAVFKIPCQLILCVNIAFVVAGNVILVLWAQSNLTMLWTSSILFGFGFSSIYPSFSAYIERYVNFTNFIASLMIVSGSGVAALYPIIIGSFIEDNPIILSYTSFFSIVMMFFSFGTLSYLTFKNKTRYT